MSDNDREEYRLNVRYRHIRRRFTFYEPPKKLSENDQSWDELMQATRDAFTEAFGKVTDYMIGVSQYIHGPVVPISVLIKQPSRFTDCILDVILYDDSPYLSDLQSTHNLKNPEKSAISELFGQIDSADIRKFIQVNKLDYETLLEIKEDDLEELGMSLGLRKKAMKSIKNWQKEEKEKRINQKWTWEEAQQQLAAPRDLPYQVKPIEFSRLQGVRYREDFGQFLRQHLRYQGYALIKLPTDIIEKINSFKPMWNEFFDRELEEKEQTSLDKDEHNGGYGGFYDERDRQMFQVAPMMLGCTPPWPEGEIEFQKKAVELFRLLENITKTCLEALARSIGIDPQLFLGVCEESFHPRLFSSSLRVCRYKKNKSNKGSLCAEHTDTTILSLGLVSDVPELQFFDKSIGDWIDVEEDVDETHAVLFVGRVLARMTAGYFQPAYHRVFRRHREERLSFPFFLRPREDASLEIEKIIKTSSMYDWKRPSCITPVENIQMNPDMWR